MKNIFEILSPVRENIKKVSAMQESFEKFRSEWDEEDFRTYGWYSAYSEHVGFPTLPCLEYYMHEEVMFITVKQFEHLLKHEEKLANVIAVDDRYQMVVELGDCLFAVWEDESEKLEVYKYTEDGFVLV